MEKKAYYSIDPGGKLKCRKCNVPLEKGRARFMYLDNGFPVELPLCPVCGFVYVPEERRRQGAGGGKGVRGQIEGR